MLLLQQFRGCNSHPMLVQVAVLASVKWSENYVSLHLPKLNFAVKSYGPIHILYNVILSNRKLSFTSEDSVRLMLWSPERIIRLNCLTDLDLLKINQKTILKNKDLISISKNSGFGETKM